MNANKMIDTINAIEREWIQVYREHEKDIFTDQPTPSNPWTDRPTWGRFKSLAFENQKKVSAFIYAITTLCKGLGISLPTSMKEIKKVIFTSDHGVKRIINEWTTDPTWTLAGHYGEDFPKADEYRHQLGGYSMFMTNYWRAGARRRVEQKALKLGTTPETAKHFIKMEREIDNLTKIIPNI